MSLGFSSLRALPRSRIPSARTLFFFPSHTTVHSQCMPATEPATRRNMASREQRSHYVPFEDGVFPTTQGTEPAQRSTVTNSERAAFQKLYRKFDAQARIKGSQRHPADMDSIADKYYNEAEEKQEEDRMQAMDALFDEALKGTRYARSTLSAPAQRSVEDDFKRLQEKELLPVREKKVQSRRREARAEAAQLTQRRIAERQRVDGLLQNARTDYELWQILNREVLDPIRKLRLDQPPEEEHADREGEPDERAGMDSRILFANFPHHLIVALVILRTEFPASSLPLCFLPTIKSLGRSAYALGATTALYTHLIRHAWLQCSSYSHIHQLLVDMNNGTVEFDSDILHVLDAIIKEHDMALSSRLGREIQMVYQMEQFLEGINNIKEWRQMIATKTGHYGDGGGRGRGL